MSTGLVQRLRQRKMAQWALAFGAGAWVLLQVLGLAADSYEWPRVVMRVAFGVVVLGFIATLVLAWYHGERGEQKVGGTELLILALLLAVGGGVLWQVERGSTTPATTAPAVVATPATAPAPGPDIAPDRRSIAVLPFANLSSDADNAYFADGIQDEILTRLANIGELRVVSRTSTQRYASAPDDLPAIARQLGVANIVEGSVQKVGDAVRINVQLIEARTDTHLWAEIYDRKLVDVFSIQSEVAAAIADALQATLTQAEKTQVDARPTSNIAAYDAYLRGLSYEHRSNDSVETYRKARDLFAEAVRLDPGFAEAWMHRVLVQSFLYFNNFERTPAALASMRAGAETVATLQPDSGNAWLALGYYRYRGLRDYPAAVAAFEKALERKPKDPEPLGALLFVQRRLGRVDVALGYVERLVPLDPGNPAWASAQGELLSGLRRFPEARAAFERALNLSPDESSLIARKASTWQSEGDLVAAAEVLAKLPALQPDDLTAAGVMLAQHAYARRYDEALAMLEALGTRFEAEAGDQRWALLDNLVSVATVLDLKGDTAAARVAAGKAMALAAELQAGDDGSYVLPAYLAPIHLVLGDEPAAIAAGRLFLKSREKDLLGRQAAALQLAGVLARCGQHGEAIELLAWSLENPYGTTPALLRLDPAFDPLRKDARFQRLSAAPGA